MSADRLREEIETFSRTATWVDGLVHDLPPEAWDGPGLGQWDMRALVGHTSRALITVEHYLGRPADIERVTSAAEYYERTGSSPAVDADAVLQRGIEAGEALGDDPARMFRTIAERVAQQMLGVSDELIETIVGGMRLSSYLPTRTFELVVHGLDIADAARIRRDPPDAALRRTLGLATELAVRSGEGSRVLLALTGRMRLEGGFSVLP